MLLDDRALCIKGENLHTISIDDMKNNEIRTSRALPKAFNRIAKKRRADLEKKLFVF